MHDGSQFTLVSHFYCYSQHTADLPPTGRALWIDALTDSHQPVNVAAINGKENEWKTTAEIARTTTTTAMRRKINNNSG